MQPLTACAAIHCYTLPYTATHTATHVATHTTPCSHTLRVLQYTTTRYQTGQRRPTGCLRHPATLQVIFRKRATNYRTLLRKMTCKDDSSYGSSPSCTVVCDVAVYGSTCSVWLHVAVCVAVCASTLRVCCSAACVLQRCDIPRESGSTCNRMLYVALRCSVMQCLAECCNVLQHVAMCCSMLQCVAVCCSALEHLVVRRGSPSLPPHCPSPPSWSPGMSLHYRVTKRRNVTRG